MAGVFHRCVSVGVAAAGAWAAGVRWHALCRIGFLALRRVLGRDVYRLHGGNHADQRWQRAGHHVPGTFDYGADCPRLHRPPHPDAYLDRHWRVPLAGASNWTITQPSHAQGHNVDLVPAVFVGAVFSCLFTLPLAFPFEATNHDLVLLGYLGVFQLGIPCVLAVLCAQVLKAPELALLALLEVIFGILLAWVGAGEAPGQTVLIGGTLVIGALVANELLGWKQRTL